MGEGPKARNQEGDGRGCKILPNMSTNSGFRGWEDEGGSWAERPLLRSFHSRLGENCVLGKGPE